MRSTLAGFGGALALVVAATVACGAAQPASDGNASDGKTMPVKWAVPDRPPPLRIKPVADWTDEYQNALGLVTPGPNGYLKSVGANHLELWKAWSGFQGQIIRGHILLERHKELLILRTAYLVNADFVWNSHTKSAPARGIPTSEIPRIIEGPDAEGWTAQEAALLRAADELHHSQFITEATWKALDEGYNDAEMLEVVFMVGMYQTLAMYQKSVGIPLPEGATTVPR